jgi:hypothetical protein
MRPPPKKRDGPRARRADSAETTGQRPCDFSGAHAPDASIEGESNAALYVVSTKKSSGEWMRFESYRERKDAQQAVDLLRWAGAIARVEVVRQRDVVLPR